jgi:hypothetical protein
MSFLGCGYDAKYVCSGCSVMRYCSIGCQRDDWNKHKTECPLIKDMPVRYCKFIRTACIEDVDEADLGLFLRDNIVHKHLCPVVVKWSENLTKTIVFPNTINIIGGELVYVKKKYLKRIPHFDEWMEQYLFLNPEDRELAKEIGGRKWWCKAALECKRLEHKRLKVELKLLIIALCAADIGDDIIGSDHAEILRIYHDILQKTSALIDHMSWHDLFGSKEDAKKNVRRFLRCVSQNIKQIEGCGCEGCEDTNHLLNLKWDDTVD